ncbi:molybdate ABC transporter substrate-binding protein [Ghiorsea bivora]|uniref:molybdate ABC transporter substrate-binding protein n=1 Tax=Ghiorsea bivora TaxID=1485545 RepID=UPI001E57D29E|nr:molybdate ABC transporter substrate-binding protein [Ghiorsea bivora]
MFYFFHHRERRVTQKKTKVLFYAIVLCASLWLCGSQSYGQEILTVAVASSFYEQAKAYSTQFEATHDIKVRLVSGSTGRLFNQISQGAPFDIFIAADKAIAAKIQRPSKIIAYSYLGLMDTKQNRISLAQLPQADIQHIAIANPQVAPFGKAAKQVLEQAGLWQVIKPKLVYAQNAMQAVMMVKQGLIDAGFVPVHTNQGALASITYTAVLLSDKAESFYQLLVMDETDD